MAPFPGQPGVSRYQKGKTIWILLKQEAVSGSGISWAVCKSNYSTPCLNYTYLLPEQRDSVNKLCHENEYIPFRKEN